MTTEIIPDNSGNQASTAKLIYILYLIAIVFGLTGIIGVIVAYIYRGDGPDWLQSHYQFQIRTFWIGGLYLTIGLILTLILVGYLILFCWVIWLIIRCIKGLKALDTRRPHPNPTGWMI